MPLIQIPAKATYQVTDIIVALSGYLPKLKPIEAEVELQPNRVAVRESAREVSEVKLASDRVCPKCSSHMVVKVAKKGKNIGKEFWACSAFPKCRHIDAKHNK